MQRKWIELMCPEMSMLKFRVPYNTPVSNAYDYLDGELCIQPWAPPFSGETRLITDGRSTKIYREYEAKLHYVNIVVRPHMKYNTILAPADFQRVADISHSFDCSYEIFIWMQYAVMKKPTDTLGIIVPESQWVADQMIHACKLLHRGLASYDSKKNRSSKK
jgi:hypothetical protein